VSTDTWTESEACNKCWFYRWWHNLPWGSEACARYQFLVKQARKESGVS